MAIISGSIKKIPTTKQANRLVFKAHSQVWGYEVEFEILNINSNFCLLLKKAEAGEIFTIEEDLCGRSTKVDAKHLIY